MQITELQKKIEMLLPQGCTLSKTEIEGPDIVIYLKGIDKLYEMDNPIRDIATAIKKKIIVRADMSTMLPPDEAEKKVKEIVPETAGVKGISFCPEFHEVWIEAMKPGIVIGKGGMTLKSIIKTTGWTPHILRSPTLPSEIIKGVRASMLKESDTRKKFLTKIGKKIFAPHEKTTWVKTMALGGHREVGRSCVLLETSNDKILLDCGVNPDISDPTTAYPYISAANIPIDEIDAIIISHAHLDHCGFIPYLFTCGYEGPVYLTPPTRDLMALLHFDYIKVMKRGGNTPIYSEKDVRKCLAHCVTREYGEVTDITPEIKLTFHNAGHILGSAISHLHISDGLHNLIYTGDIKYGGTRLFNPATTTFPRGETVIMESTYGGKDDILPQRAEAEMKLLRIISETMSNGGKVLIPVFSVGRSQEVMLVLEEFARRTGFNRKVYIDGMVMEASAIHTVYPEYLRDNVQRMILSNKSPFESPIFELVKSNRQEIIDSPDPCVIIAPSGMLSGGPSVEYLKMMGNNEKNAMIFVGYQGVNTLGRKIQRGDREVATLDDEGRMQSIHIKMRIETAEGFSGHSDRRQLIAFAKNLKPKPSKIFTVHGEESKCEDLAYILSRIMRVEARAPMNLDGIRLK